MRIMYQAEKLKRHKEPELGVLTGSMFPTLKLVTDRECRHLELIMQFRNKKEVGIREREAQVWFSFVPQRKVILLLRTV